MATMREALEAHMDKVEAAPPEAAAAPEAPAKVESAPAAVEAPTAVIGGRPRDEAGKFAKAEVPGATPKSVEKAGNAPAAPGEAKVGGEAPPQAPPPTEAAKRRLPQDMSAPVRELANKLGPEYQPLIDEWDKRYRETSKVLQESAQARQLAQRVQETLAPYETVARANGTDAMTFATNVLQTATALQMGAAPQKAGIIAQLINQYGIDPGQVAAALDGSAPPPAQQQQPINVQAEFQRLWEERETKARYDVASQQASKFVGSQPEFLTDVWRDMGPILSSAKANGIDMTYESAYDSACWANPKVRAILQQREAAKSVQASNADVQKAVAAASGVRTSQAAPAATPKGLRAHLEAAADAQGIRE